MNVAVKNPLTHLWERGRGEGSLIVINILIRLDGHLLPVERVFHDRGFVL